MKILVTGSGGFVGKNLVAALHNIRSGKDRTHPGLSVSEIFEYDIHTAPELLETYCAQADFVFHLAGVNRPQNPEEFMEGNFGFSSRLLDTLKAQGNRCPVMLSSSVQATGLGRYAGSEYGRSKKAGEELFFSYGAETGAPVLVYRFPNLFGKWCRPNYNSAVATFCHNMARDLPVTVSDPSVELELCYIDDLVAQMLLALEGKPHRCDYEALEPVPSEEGRYCYVPVTHRITLGALVELLERFRNQPKTLVMPPLMPDSLEKKLYSTYLSYLPPEKIAFPLKKNEDHRGSFTELLRTLDCGQFGVNISKPGAVKGQHWHHSKWELFIVVSGEGLIQQRRLDSDEVLEFRVSGREPQAVHMLPGYTHNIINLSDTEEMITFMWANECFDPQKPDTYREVVE